MNWSDVKRSDEFLTRRNFTRLTVSVGASAAQLPNSWAPSYPSVLARAEDNATNRLGERGICDFLVPPDQLRPSLKLRPAGELVTRSSWVGEAVNVIIILLFHTLLTALSVCDQQRALLLQWSCFITVQSRSALRPLCCPAYCASCLYKCKHFIKLLSIYLVLYVLLVRAEASVSSCSFIYSLNNVCLLSPRPALRSFAYRTLNAHISTWTCTLDCD